MTAVTGLKPDKVGEPFGLVAGGGRLPRLVAERLALSGWRPLVVPVADGMSDDWTGFEARPMGWGRTGDVFAHFARAGIRHAAFCGTVSARPDYRSILPSLRTLRLLPEILQIVRGGDDSVLRAVSKAFERRGFVLHAIQELVPELLMPAGPLGLKAPCAEDLAALALAERAARRLGELDVGQAAVASADRVIALEGIEGTRDMLARVADLRARGRVTRSERCVLFKSVKPQQDSRFDLPSIGVATIDEADRAGLVGVGLTAGRSLLIDAADVLGAVNERGLFLVGVEPEAGTGEGA